MNDGELERLVALAPAQARELLKIEGYFHADVRATIEPGEPPRVRVQVQPWAPGVGGHQPGGAIGHAGQRARILALATRTSWRMEFSWLE